MANDNEALKKCDPTRTSRPHVWGSPKNQHKYVLTNENWYPSFEGKKYISEADCATFNIRDDRSYVSITYWQCECGETGALRASGADDHSVAKWAYRAKDVQRLLWHFNNTVKDWLTQESYHDKIGMRTD